MKLPENETARKKILKRGKNNLFKKAEELSILCDSKILIITFNPDKQKHEIWPDNDEEAKQIINRFKRKSAKGGGEKAFGSSASQKKRFGEKSPIPDHKRMINHLSENQLQNLCCKLDDKIADAVNVVEAKKQDLTEGPKVSVDEGKGKEVVLYQEPVPIQQDHSFQMPNGPSSYPLQLNGASTGSNIPFVPVPIRYYDPSRMQPAYINSNPSLMSYNGPTHYHIPPGNYYPIMPGFRSSQMNGKF